MSSILRAIKIARTVSSYGLEEWIPDPRLKPVLHVLKLISPTAKQNKDLSRGTRLRLALQQLGPLFVKFGQVLSTRRDLLPADIADELAGLRDQVKPFDSVLARQMIEKAFAKPITEEQQFLTITIKTQTCPATGMKTPTRGNNHIHRHQHHRQCLMVVVMRKCRKCFKIRAFQMT